MNSLRIIYAVLMSYLSLFTVNSIQDVAFFQMTTSEYSASDEFISVLNECDEEMVNRWTSDFHTCFMQRKFKDGGRNLESIEDRILDHAEACVETSDKDCRPNYAGFKNIFGKVLEQMKDYSSMYLQEIHMGREKIRDLKCIEEKLSMDVYEKCFADLPDALRKTDYEIQSAVKSGIECTNRENIECSRGARTSLNRMVRTINGIENPPEEDEMEVTAEPIPPKKWYDYIADPFVSAWVAVKTFFTGIFG